MPYPFFFILPRAQYRIGDSMGNSWEDSDAKSDNLSYVPRIVIAGKREEDQFSWMRENKVVVKAVLCTLQIIEGLAYAAKNAGNRDEQINKALKGLLEGENKLWLGEEIKPEEALSIFTPAKILSELGATKESLTADWIKNIRESLETEIKICESLEKEKGTVIRKEGGEPPISQRIGLAAEISYEFQQAGVSVMGKYVLKTNDCFDYCVLNLEVASGPQYVQAYLKRNKRDSERILDEQRMRGTAEYSWPANMKSGEAVGNLAEGSFVKTHSFKDRKIGEHWWIYYNGNFYSFTDDGIQKTPAEQFVEDRRRVLCAINPIEPDRFAQVSNKKRVTTT